MPVAPKSKGAASANSAQRSGTSLGVNGALENPFVLVFSPSQTSPAFVKKTKQQNNKNKVIIYSIQWKILGGPEKGKRMHGNANSKIIKPAVCTYLNSQAN